jgi:hypothetical protein
MFIFYKDCRVNVAPFLSDGKVTAHAVIERSPLTSKPGAYQEQHDSGILGSFDTFDDATLCAIGWAYAWIDENWS